MADLQVNLKDQIQIICDGVWHLGYILYIRSIFLSIFPGQSSVLYYNMDKVAGSDLFLNY